MVSVFCRLCLLSLTPWSARTDTLKMAALIEESAKNKEPRLTYRALRSLVSMRPELDERWARADPGPSPSPAPPHL